MKLDALAFGAHPDDIELVVSGTLLKLADLGYNTGVVDMVRGELGTRGTPQIRAREAQASARILSLKLRENLKLTDGQIFNIGNPNNDFSIRVSPSKDFLFYAAALCGALFHCRHISVL